VEIVCKEELPMKKGIFDIPAPIEQLKVVDRLPLAELVESAAQSRKEPVVAREHILEAIRRIDAGEETVETYPMGDPSLRGVYDLAVRIEAEKTKKN
jgi:hypothetical protein